MADVAFMRSPYTGEIKEVEATPEALSPLMAAGWIQVPAPAAASIKEEPYRGEHK